MRKSLEDRFREVDRMPTPWDRSADQEASSAMSSWPRIRGIVLAAASLAVAGLVVVVAIKAADDGGPAATPDASWLMTTRGSCVEQFSAESLPNRDYAFEGVVVAVRPPANAEGTDPVGATTTVVFDVRQWFWGGTGDEARLRTYAAPPVSTEDLDASIGAHLLVSGDEDFFWSCGFTKPFSNDAAGEFDAAAAEVGA